MSHTQADLKRMIAAGTEDLKMVLDGYKHLSEYKEASSEIEELRKKLMFAEKRQAEIIVNYRKSVQEDIDMKKEDIEYLQDLLDDLQRGLDVNDYNDELIKMFKAFHSRFTTSQNKRLQWVDDEMMGRFAIFKTTSSEGVSVAWYLYEIVEDFNDDIKLDGCHIWKTEGGRWNKKKFEEAMRAKEGFLNREFFLNLLEELGWERHKYRGCDYRLEFTAPDYDHSEEWEKKGEKSLKIDYLKIPNTDQEAFEMYPVLKKYYKT